MVIYWYMCIVTLLTLHIYLLLCTCSLRTHTSLVFLSARVFLPNMSWAWNSAAKRYSASPMILLLCANNNKTTWTNFQVVISIEAYSRRFQLQVWVVARVHNIEESALLWYTPAEGRIVKFWRNTSVLSHFS